jgi:hypothetical protein
MTLRDLLARGAAVICVVASISAIGASSNIEMSVRHYEYFKANGGDAFTLYLKGLENGFGVANAFLTIESKRPLYCQPGKLVLTHDNVARILDAEMKVTRRDLDTPLSMVVLDGLRRTFPCKE